MWQTVVVLLLLAGVLVYVIRHYVGVFKSETPGCSCSGCPGGCDLKPLPSDGPGERFIADGKSDCPGFSPGRAGEGGRDDAWN